MKIEFIDYIFWIIHLFHRFVVPAFRGILCVLYSTNNFNLLTNFANIWEWVTPDKIKSDKNNQQQLNPAWFQSKMCFYVW